MAAARGWIGTPYIHQASRQGAGADCLGLLRGVWRTLYGAEPEAPPPYTPDWAEQGAAETLLGAAARHLIAIPPARAGLGDVLVFRMRAAGPAKHVAILASPWLEPGRILHAYSGASVAETHLTPSWLRRLAGAFRFPARHA
nr:peptidase P60 [Limibaculum sp. NKW23]